MCLSSIGQIVFGIVLVAITILTAVALFTTGWTYFDLTHPGDWHTKNLTQGIVPWDCAKTIVQGGSISCDQWWSAQPGWMKTVAVCMWLALIAEIITLIYNLFVFFACCCKSCLMTPLAILSCIVTVLLAIAVITYGVNAKDVMLYQGNGSLYHDTKNYYDENIGYSFWLAMVALLLAVGDTILAFITACLGTMCC